MEADLLRVPQMLLEESRCHLVLCSINLCTKGYL